MSSKERGFQFRREGGILCSWGLGRTSWGSWATPLPVGSRTAHLGWLCPHLAQRAAPRAPRLTLPMVKGVTPSTPLAEHVSTRELGRETHTCGESEPVRVRCRPQPP